MGFTHENVIFDILEPPAFRKYSICWVFQVFSVQLVLHVFCNLSIANRSDKEDACKLVAGLLKLGMDHKSTDVAMHYGQYIMCSELAVVASNGVFGICTFSHDGQMPE